MEIGNMIRNLDQELSAEGNSKDCRKHERFSPKVDKPADGFGPAGAVVLASGPYIQRGNDLAC
jgi:hypothetical protein